MPTNWGLGVVSRSNDINLKKRNHMLLLPEPQIITNLISCTLALYNNMVNSKIDMVSNSNISYSSA